MFKAESSECVTYKLSVGHGHLGKGTRVGDGKGGVCVGTGHKGEGKPVYIEVKPDHSPFS